MRKRTIRLSEELVDQIREHGKKRGFATASAFMRAAIERELSGSETMLDGTEERLAATIDRLAGTAPIESGPAGVICVSGRTYQDRPDMPA